MSININYNNNSYAQSGSYYQLASSKSDTSKLSTEQQAALKKIEDATGYSSSYILDLSKNASDFLNGNATHSSASNTDGFILSKSQKKTLQDILVKYKDEPQTQDTFNKIQDDLKKAGLDPDSLTVKDKAKSFNPIQTFLDILSGKSENNAEDPLKTKATDESQYQTKKSNYLNQVIDIWKNNSL